MEVWVVEFEYAFEPGFVLGVYSTEEKAKEAAVKHCEGDKEYLSNATYTKYLVDGL